MYRAPLIHRLAQKRIFFEFATRFASKNKNLGLSFDNFRKNFQVNNSILKEFKKSAAEKNIVFTKRMFDESEFYIVTRIKAEIARSFWGVDKYRRIMLEIDNQYRAALELFPYTHEILTGQVDEILNME
jgi:hypothetical protein